MGMKKSKEPMNATGDTGLLHSGLFKLGKQAPKIDQRTLKLARYLVPGLPAPPAESSWVMKIKDWGMMLNDNLGDCTCAAPGHMIQQWTYYAGHEVVPPDSTILKAYEAVGGYNPNDPGTDNGANMLDVLNYWRKTGIDGHKILAYVSVDPKNLTEVKQAVELFGNVYLGIQLPVSAQNERAWTVPSGGIYSAQGQPGSWGGHAIPVMAYSSKTLTCITWGARLKMSWNFFEDYTDELYAVLSQDWVAKSGVAPSKLNLAQLQTDLAAL